MESGSIPFEVKIAFIPFELISLKTIYRNREGKTFLDSNHNVNKNIVMK